MHALILLSSKLVSVDVNTVILWLHAISKVTGTHRGKCDLQLQMSQPGAPQALKAPLIKQPTGLSGEPESKLLLAIAHCGLEQQLLVLVRLCSFVACGNGGQHGDCDCPS